MTTIQVEVDDTVSIGDYQEVSVFDIGVYDYLIFNEGYPLTLKFSPNDVAAAVEAYEMNLSTTIPDVCTPAESVGSALTFGTGETCSVSDIAKFILTGIVASDTGNTIEGICYKIIAHPSDAGDIPEGLSYSITSYPIDSVAIQEQIDSCFNSTHISEHEDKYLEKFWIFPYYHPFLYPYCQGFRISHS